MNDAGPDVSVAHAQLLGEDGGDRKSRVDSAALLLVTLGLGVVPLLYLTGNMEIVQVNMLGRYLCFAIVAVSLDLIWGYTGLLCLTAWFCFGNLHTHLLDTHDAETFRAHLRLEQDLLFFSGEKEQASGRPFAEAVKYLTFLIFGNDPAAFHLLVVAMHTLAA